MGSIQAAFKKWYFNHRRSFAYEIYRQGTSLSKYVWDIYIYIYIYKYIYIYIYIIKGQPGFPWLSLSLSLSLCICPYYPSLQAGLPNYILFLHSADVNIFLLVANTGASMCCKSIEEHYLWVRPCFANNAPYVLFVLFAWFLRWEVSGCTTVVLWGVASRIDSKQAFSPYGLLVSIWCIHTVVIILLQFGKKSCFILLDSPDFHMIDNLSIAVHAFARGMLISISVDEMLLTRYVDVN